MDTGRNRAQNGKERNGRREPAFSTRPDEEKRRKEDLPRGQYDPRDFGHDPDRNNRGAHERSRGGRGESGQTAGDEARRRQMENKRRDDMGEARRQAASRRRFIEHRRGIILAVLITLFTFGLLFGIYKLAFVVRSVTVTGNETYGEEEIIEASGVRRGINLYSFRASTAEAQISFKCPYVGEVEVKRTVPSSVALTVTEDKAVFYADIFGKIAVLSEWLRVLESSEAENASVEGLIKLKLPGISYAVEGRELRFADSKDEKAVRATLEAVMASALSGRIGSVDMTDTFSITASCDGKYLLVIGNSSDVDVKLKAAAKVLEDEIFSSGNKARLDLTDVTQTSVVFDNTIKLD